MRRSRRRCSTGRRSAPLGPGPAPPCPVLLLTVVKPAILLRRRLDWMIATSSQMRLLVSKSWVSLW